MNTDTWTCRGCGSPEGRRGRSRLCRDCYNADRRDRYQSAIEAGATYENWWESTKDPCDLCHIKPRLSQRSRCEDCDPLCRECGSGTRTGGTLLCASCLAAKRRDRYANDPADRFARLTSNRAGNAALRKEVFTAYGNACICCSETEPVFLTLDHIDNDGAEERRTINRYGGIQFYRYVRSIGCPQDRYQILCWNCNSAKHILGICPHQVPATGIEPV